MQIYKKQNIEKITVWLDLTLKSNIFMKNVVIWRQPENGDTSNMTANNLTYSFVRSNVIIMISPWVKQHAGMKRSWLELSLARPEEQ